MLKKNIVIVNVNKYLDLNCSYYKNKTFRKYTCYYDYDVKTCCDNIIDIFYNYLDKNTSKIEENKCYNYSNNTYTLECKFFSYEFHLFVYFIITLFMIIFLVSFFYCFCYFIKCRKNRNEYRSIENNMITHSNNSLFNNLEFENE